MKTDQFGSWLAVLLKLTVGQREKLTRALSSIDEADEVFSPRQQRQPSTQAQDTQVRRGRL